jgi:hypothetical protein
VCEGEAGRNFVRTARASHLLQAKLLVLPNPFLNNSQGSRLYPRYLEIDGRAHPGG